MSKSSNASDGGSEEIRLRLVRVRQLLSAPAATIVGFAELLSENVAEAGLDDFSSDLARIMTAAGNLKAMVADLLESEAASNLLDGRDIEESERRLRHDLRTPINAIKGYAEMLAEDLEDDGGHEELLTDFSSIVSEADKLLADIDRIVAIVQGGELDVATTAENDERMAFAQVADLIALSREVEVAHTGTILVVDDIEANRDLLSRRLSRDGHRVLTADGGRRALEMLGDSDSDSDIDVVLLDLLMPDMNGLEVLQHMRSDDALHDTPVIVVSALDETDSAIRCIEAGAEDYLAKPVNPILLRARLNACLERRQWQEKERLYLSQLQQEKDKSDRLLLNNLPSEVIERLNAGESVIADRYDEVTVVVSDIVGFTNLATEVSPSVLVERLNRLFSEFDRVAPELGVEKIKTVGDAYMAVSGLPTANPDHAASIARMALAMRDAAEEQNKNETPRMELRIGLHSGPVIAGIIGTHKFVYDIWGDTVNLASRMEQNSLPGHILMTGAVARRLGNEFVYESRGRIAIKGIGRLETFYLEGFAD